MMRAVKKKLSPQEVREVVALSKCDVKTVRRWMVGESVRPTSRERIEDALKQVRGRK
jgi:hypothetical protein